MVISASLLHSTRDPTHRVSPRRFPVFVPNKMWDRGDSCESFVRLTCRDEPFRLFYTPFGSPDKTPRLSKGSSGVHLLGDQTKTREVKFSLRPLTWHRCPLTFLTRRVWVVTPSFTSRPLLSGFSLTTEVCGSPWEPVLPDRKRHQGFLLGPSYSPLSCLWLKPVHFVIGNTYTTEHSNTRGTTI